MQQLEIAHSKPNFNKMYLPVCIRVAELEEFYENFH